MAEQLVACTLKGVRYTGRFEVMGGDQDQRSVTVSFRDAVMSAFIGMLEPCVAAETLLKELVQESFGTRPGPSRQAA